MTNYEGILLTLPDDTNPVTGKNATASLAAKILEGKDIGFKVSTTVQRQKLLVAHALKGKAVYGRAFDIMKVEGNISEVLSDIDTHLEKIMLYEIKSTNRKLDENFSGYFFALTTAELLVAQSLGERYRFVFVNTTNEEHLVLTLSDIFAKARGIYPTWSIRF